MANETQPGTEGQDDLLLEQATISELQNTDQRPVIETEQPATKVETETDKPATEQQERLDPRAARLESLAEKRHTEGNEELIAATAAMVDPAAPAVEAAPAERMIKLKVRGEIVELPESEVIAKAQKVDAADSYLEEARGLLTEAKKTRTEPAPAQQQPAPKVEPEKVDRLAAAIEQIQLGADPAEVRALLDTEVTERARTAARETLDEDRTAYRMTNFDNDVDEGYAAVTKDHPDMAGDPIAKTVVVAVAGGMEAALIGNFLKENADDATKAAFAGVNITPETLAGYSPTDAHALYKDMVLKGYPLHRPSDIIKAAGKTVAERFAGTTTRQPAPQQQQQQPAPKPVDRTERKQALQQPERQPIPRNPSTGNFVSPKTEKERATDARSEMRADRKRAGQRG